MGTRSSIGVHVNGKDKLTYNQYDGYPTGVGKDVFKQVCDLIQSEGWDKVKKMAVKLRQVQTSRKFTAKQKEKYGKYWEQVSTGEDMYSLLRGLQGELGLMLKEGIMTKHNAFILDSLFCEWAYILNVDNKTFEIYQGFQKEPPTAGRYKDAPADNGYYACNLIYTIQLSDDVNHLYNALAIDDDFWIKLENEEIIEETA